MLEIAFSIYFRLDFFWGLFKPRSLYARWLALQSTISSRLINLVSLETRLHDSKQISIVKKFSEQ